MFFFLSFFEKKKKNGAILHIFKHSLKSLRYIMEILFTIRIYQIIYHGGDVGIMLLFSKCIKCLSLFFKFLNILINTFFTEMKKSE